MANEMFALRVRLNMEICMIPFKSLINSYFNDLKRYVLCSQRGK